MLYTLKFVTTELFLLSRAQWWYSALATFLFFFQFLISCNRLSWLHVFEHMLNIFMD